MKFRQVYTALHDMNQAVKAMGVDLENASNKESKGVISDEIHALTQSYNNLYNADLLLDVDLDLVRKQIDHCMKNVDVY
ncbi:hypothetical protein GRF59_05420 [Paenibacillus sp. HJL G12]|uniref:Uncharacterized protein n=1 Tax=Paenibacillus dendrobii TaxID=2691084 RepID=A0A7X3IGE3_9BACL|nr:hypothetical protein [Paenibacillus dendrobii]MWV43063.1 hypothetical protein [Paenibacillus dendrobii]